MNAVKAPRTFDEKFVRELVVNIPEVFGDVLDVDYDCMTVRGKQVIFSPRLINELLGISISATMPLEENWDDIAQILTGGRVRKWKGHSFESKFLTTKFALLQGICIRNWIPITHCSTINRPVGALIYHISRGKHSDLGQIIFDQLAAHAVSSNPNLPIGHPSMIYQLLIKLAPGLSRQHSGLTVPKPLAVDWKVFIFEHIVDISVPKSIHQVLKWQGKAPMEEISSLKHSLNKTELEQLTEQLHLLDRAREVIVALIARIKEAQGDQESEGESDSASGSD